MSSKKPSDPNRPSAKVAERLAVIVDAAERAALTVIDDAEKEARRYLEEARARADRIIAERLREAADQFDREGGGRPVAGPQPPAIEEPPPAPVHDFPVAEEEPVEWEEPGLEPHTPRPHVVPAPEPDEAALEAGGPGELSQAGDSSSAAARLLATQMAVSGSSREEIEMRLRTGFEIEDTSDILNAILGPEG
jgi:hypothetical protein